MKINNTQALLETLTSEIAKVTSGQVSHERGNAVANLAGKVISTLTLEMQYAQLRERRFYSSFIKLEADPTERQEPSRVNGNGHAVRRS